MHDLTGRQFGKLTVTGPADQGLPQVAGGWWLGRCVCGYEVIAPAEAFLSRRLVSCPKPTPEERAEHEAQLAATRPPVRW
jgi:hypothetical protein